MVKRIVPILLFVGIITAQNSIVKQFSTAIADVAEKANPAVVTITAEKTVKMDETLRQFDGFPFFHPQFPEEGYSSKALGSGVIVDAKKGYILTNNHVVNDAEEISIKLMDKREIPATVLGTDPNSDLALLQIDANNITQIPLGDSDKLRVGEWVLAVGSPFSADLSHTVTAGIVSALGRGQVIQDASLYQNFIQTDAAINPGNSGGALLNLDGELVGINTAIATGGYERSNRGVGFAIPSNMIKKVMNDLINKGYVVRSWIGVTIQEVNDKVARALDLSTREGAIVTEVMKDSPADKSDIKTGDIIIEFNGVDISNTSHLKNVVSSTEPGRKSKVKVIRDGDYKMVNVILEELPQDISQVFATNSPKTNTFGVEVSNISSSIAEKYGIDKDVVGVVVSGIDRKSNAYKAGIREGDIITRVGTKKVESIKEFNEIINTSLDQESLLFLVKRGDRSSYIAFEID